jgi:hypothetical protein
MPCSKSFQVVVLEVVAKEQRRYPPPAPVDLDGHPEVAPVEKQGVQARERCVLWVWILGEARAEGQQQGDQQQSGEQGRAICLVLAAAELPLRDGGVNLIFMTHFW